MKTVKAPFLASTNPKKPSVLQMPLDIGQDAAYFNGKYPFYMQARLLRNSSKDVLLLNEKH